MRFWGIFRFELGYQLRRPWPWLIFAALLAVTFLGARDTAVADAMSEDYAVNAPFAIAVTTVIGTLFWLMAAAVVAGDAAARDVATRMHALIYTAPVSRAEYLGGRFLAALALNALLLLAVQAGVLLAVSLPGVNAAAVAPFRPAAYLTAYAYLALPSAIVGTAVQFGLAVRSGRAMAGYVGSLMLLFIGLFVASVLLYYRDVGSLVDPIGMRFVIEDLAHQWTTVERKSRLLSLEGTVLANRLLWLGVAVAVLAVTYVRFRFEHRTERGAWWRRGARDADAPGAPRPGVAAGARVTVPEVVRSFGVAVQARQALAIAWSSFRNIAASRAGLAVLVGLPALSIPMLLAQLGAASTPQVPATALVVPELTAPLTAPLSADLNRWMIIPLLLAFFAGELVWRERDAGVGEITDTMPWSEWPPLLGKLLGLGLLLAALMVGLMVAGIFTQALLGHRDFQLGLYLTTMLGLQLSEYLLFALLALVVHALANQKYVGHLLAIMAFAYIAWPALFHVHDTMLVYGAGPWWAYSEMRGFGATLGPWAWHKAYWAAWAMLLAVLARLFWARGRDGDMRARLRLARRRLTRPTIGAAAVAAGLVAVSGEFVYARAGRHHISAGDEARLRAEYEQRYKRYQAIPQPRLTATHLRVEIRPARREAEIRGTYTLVNAGVVPIDSVHVAVVPGAWNGPFTFDRAAAAVVSDEVHGHRIYALGAPLQPGDSLRLRFEVRIDERQNRGVDASVVPNGTFFTNQDWLPALGYQPRRELTSASDRREHRLPPRPVIAALHDSAAWMTAGERTTLEVIVGTDGRQIAVAPGALRRTWTEGGRRYFHYATDGAIANRYALFSADYAVREERWTPPAGGGRPVTIRLFHHPTHTAPVDGMLRGARASLDFFTRHFGPYPYSELGLVEVRGTGIGMHADPGLIRFSEGTALWKPGDGPRSIDLPFTVVAHEVSHQWWGHQLEPAFAEGGRVIGEGLAEYSALAVVEETFGREQLLRHLAWMRRPYPYAPIRRGEPLLRGVDPYLAYRKAPFALHALSEYAGRDRVLGAMRSLLEQHPPGHVPLATTLDLYRELQAETPDTLRPLLHDLFEVNAVWEFGAERASAEQTTAGTWQVTLDLRARKVIVDTAGVETKAPIEEWVEVGVFAPAVRGSGRLSAPLYVQKHRIHAGAQTITVTVPREPALAGIDPYHTLDWMEREDDDNLRPVTIERRERAPQPTERPRRERGTLGGGSDGIERR